MSTLKRLDIRDRGLVDPLDGFDAIESNVRSNDDIRVIEQPGVTHDTPHFGNARVLAERLQWRK